MAKHALAGMKSRVVVVGGGFGGAYCAQHLSKKLPKDWSMALLDRNNFFTGITDCPRIQALAQIKDYLN